MPLTQEFKANMVALFVNQRLGEAHSRGRAHVRDDVGTHIKQPLARPKIRDANNQQQMLAHAAMASLKKRHGNIQSACNKVDETPKDLKKYLSSKMVDYDEEIVKPSQIRLKEISASGY
ncbi:hypothetical protein IV203_008922 [Nitzschia inconspicua]|uniref:Uncharacterized protein n=1 Tax=Nitzschia inconspicua TaxID=303405 RepID=A0A9K3PPW6_9STRA|nr:hypothetical protein IV203_008922 [Nitzschia inconspicua]